MLKNFKPMWEQNQNETEELGYVICAFGTAKVPFAFVF